MLGLPITPFQLETSRVYVSAIAPIFAVASLLFIARMASRWRTRGISADDYVLVFAAVSAHPCPVLDHQSLTHTRRPSASSKCR